MALRPLFLLPLAVVLGGCSLFGDRAQSSVTSPAASPAICFWRSALMARPYRGALESETALALCRDHAMRGACLTFPLWKP